MDYSNGKIYKIVCNTTGKCYIGSTCQPQLSQRLAQHSSNYKNYLNGKFSYITSFEILKEGNYDIILLEMFPCNCKEELHARERYYIENLECVNKFIPNRTKKEYREDNKDIIREKNKEYYKENKEIIKEYWKEWYGKNKEKLTGYHKEWCEQNKDKIKEYQKEYREDNKDKIKKYKQEYREDNKDIINAKFVCECGGKYTKINKSSHLKTKLHQKYLSKLNN